jgi:hypothetical protein
VVADSLTVTGHDVYATSGETSLLDEVAGVKRGQRGELGRLDNDGAAGSESRGNLPCTESTGALQAESGITYRQT